MIYTGSKLMSVISSDVIVLEKLNFLHVSIKVLGVEKMSCYPSVSSSE